MARQINPVTTYLEIRERHKAKDYSVLEMGRDVERLLNACATLIQQNSHLSARTNSAEKLVDEQTIDIFNKDMEIFNLQTQFNSISNERPND